MLKQLRDLFNSPTRIFIIAVILVVLLILFKSRCTPPITTDPGNSDSTIYWRNQFAQLVASQKGTAEQFAVRDAKTRRQLDSIAAIYNTQSKQIQELIVAVVRGKTILVPVPGSREVDTLWADLDGVPCPTIVNMRERFETPWYTADVQIGQNSYMNLYSRDTITALWKTVKEGSIFNRKKYLQFDISLADTSRKITGLTTYRHLEKTKEFSINAEAEVLYLRGNLYPMLNLGVERSMGRLTAGIYGGKEFTQLDIRQSPWYGRAKVNFKLARF